jgi:hypothetical protein
MSADATVFNLAHDLLATREIVHAALDVIALQQRRIAILTEEKLILIDELRARMGVPLDLRSVTVDGVLSAPETTAAQLSAAATEKLEAPERGRSNL